jgi:hypothetical protein
MPDIADQLMFRPKRITAEHFLAKDLASKAQAFDLGGSPAIDLKPRINGAVAMTTTLPLSEAAARKLKRRANVIEAAVAPVEDAKSIDLLQAGLKKLKVPTAEDPRSVFFALEVRRRVPGAVLGRDINRLPARVRNSFADLMSVKHEIAATERLVLQLSESGNKVRLVVAGPFGALTNYLPAATGKVVPEADDEHDEEGEREVDEHLGDDTTQDFAKCYSQCLKEVDPLVFALAGTVCTACGLAVSAGLVPGTQPVTIPALIIACSACAVVLGGIIGNCILTCHEMFG